MNLLSLHFAIHERAGLVAMKLEVLHTYCQNDVVADQKLMELQLSGNQRTIGPENAHLKPDPGVLSHHEMTLTLNTHTPLLNS